MRSILSALFSIASFTALTGQEWVEQLYDDGVDFGRVQGSFRTYWEGREPQRGKGYTAFKRLEWFIEPRAYPSGRLPDPKMIADAWYEAERMPHRSADRSASWQPLGLTNWTSNSYNPGNGRVNVVAVDPLDPAVIYVGTPMGGLWRTMNSGATWSALLDDLPTLGVSGIAIDPTDPSIIYVATGDGDGRHTYGMGVIKSTSGGANWSTTGLNWDTHQVRTTRRLLMDPTDPQTLFCAASNGLWRTTDGGTTWTKVASGSFHDVEFKPGDPNIVYACTDQFFRSSNGGATFTQITNGLPLATDVNRMRVAVSAADPQMVYVLSGREDNNGYRGLYRSTDAGLTFQLRSSTPNIFGSQQNGSDSGGQSWFDMALAIDPLDAQTVYAAGVNVWKSTNGGTSWTVKSHWIYPSPVGYTHADIHDLAVFNNILYCGSDGGLYQSAAGGDNWQDISAGLNITQFYRLGGSELAPGTLIAGCIDNGSNLLQGGAWTHVQGSDGMEAAIAPDDPQIMYCSIQNGMLYRSDDGGQNFNFSGNGISETGYWITPYAVAPGMPQRVYAGFDNVWRSDDRGDTWAVVSSFGSGGKQRAIAVAPTDANTVYVSTIDRIRRSTSGQAPWTNITSNLPAQAITSIAVHPLNKDIAYVSLSGYTPGRKVFVTTNGGGTWTNISGNLPNAPANSVVFQPGTMGGLYVGTDIGVFYTDSTLSAWQPFSDGLPHAVVNELEVNLAGDKLRAATFGRGIWETALYQPSGLPPVAGFATGPTNICSGDAITFFDASLEAAPGWTWQFPGGTPSSSTAASPSVTYSGTGSYTAQLTVNNALGSDTYSGIVPVVVFPNLVDVNITLDNYPQETSWSITDDATGTVVATGGPYSGRPVGSSLSEHVCLDQGCYTFTAHDAFGDGLCCLQGNGNYQVSNPQLGIIASGGAFGNEESTTFCVSINVGVEGRSAGILVRPLDNAGQYEVSTVGITGLRATLRVLDAIGRDVVGPTEIQPQGRTTIDLRRMAAGTYRVLIGTSAGSWSAPLVRH